MTQLVSKQTVFVFRTGKVAESVVLNALFFGDNQNIINVAVDIDADEAEALRRIGLRLSRAAAELPKNVEAPQVGAQTGDFNVEETSGH